MAFLHRDLGNLYSGNAIKVCLSNGMEIGFVPEDLAIQIAPMLDRGCADDARIKKILRGGRLPIRVIAASLYAPAEASSAPAPAARATPAPSRSRFPKWWCALLLFGTFATGILGVLVLAAAATGLTLVPSNHIPAANLPAGRILILGEQFDWKP